MEDKQQNEEQCTKDNEIPDFIRRMKQNGSTVIFKGQDFACNNKNGKR